MKISIADAEKMTNFVKVRKSNFKMNSKKVFKKTNRIKKEHVYFQNMEV